jgi:hypothetical protein
MTSFGRIGKDEYDIGDYIGPAVTTTGSGWSTSRVEGIGLTFKGIERVSKELEIEAVVIETRELLQEAIAQYSEGEPASFITDSSCISSLLTTAAHSEGSEIYTPRGLHAVALFVDRIGDRLRLYIMDSEGSTYKDDSSHQFPDDKVEVYVSRQKRQSKGDLTCYAFALRDCKTLQETPGLLDELRDKASSRGTDGDKTDLYDVSILPDLFCTENTEGMQTYARTLLKIVSELD